MFLRWVFVVFTTIHLLDLVSSLNDEGFALLSFKRNIEASAAKWLDNWNESDPNPCSWSGIQCGREERVVSITLPFKGLAGTLRLDSSKLIALQHVNLRNNFFYGSLRGELFAAGELKALILSGNSFSGSVPDVIGNLKLLQSLDLSQNSFNGSVPSTLLQCRRLRNLVLSRNGFGGSLPDGFGKSLRLLQRLNLSYNEFEGTLPGDLGNLTNLQGVLDLSHNLFNGPIPASLGNLQEFVYIDLAYNNLSGPIPDIGPLADAGPTAFIGNPYLCGSPLKNPCVPPLPLADDPSFHSGKHSAGRTSRLVIAAAISATILGFCLFALSFCFVYKKIYFHKTIKCNRPNNPEDRSIIRKDMFCFRTEDLESLSENVEQYTFVPTDPCVNFDVEQLLKASAFLLGKSGIGILYKVVLENGLTVAVKRLEDSSQRFREFQTEIEAIGKIKHPNIISLLAYCWCVNEKLLIYEYMPTGDLATAIHGRPGSTNLKPLSWPIRLKILKGIAQGLTFLHEFSPKKYVHGNLKPSNILVDETMNPRISDFGLNRLASTSTEDFLIHPSDLISTKTSQQSSPSPYALTPTNPSAVASYYRAPEASKGLKPSQKWDIYSFGVILLEIVSGKSPVAQNGSADTDIVRWIQLSIEVKPVAYVLDPFIVHELEKEGQIVEVVKIGLACVCGNPEKRPSMRIVSEALAKLN